MKTRHGRKRETNTVATVGHNKYCENVHGLLFAVIPNISMIFYSQSLFLYELVDSSGHGRPNRAQTRC